MVTYPANWKFDIIANIADITTGCRDTQDNKVNGRFPFFVRSPIVERIDVADFDCEAVLTAGDGVGTGKVFHYINGKFAAHQRVYVMSNFKDVDGRYFYYYFSNNFGKEVEKYTAKSSVDSVRRDMIAEMEFPYPPLQIGDGLMADGILTGAGKPKWRPESVKKILKNEKYIGDALLQKTYTVDVLTKKRVKNEGIVPQYYVENNHEPIIPRDLYMQVQEEMLRRSNLHSGANRKKRVYSSKYALSSIVYCSKCGEIYRRVAWNNHGKRSTVWRCVNRVENGPDCCDAPTVKEEELQNTVVQAINMALGGKDDMLSALEENISMVLALEDETSMESIDAKLEELQQELLKRADAGQNYEDLADEIDRMREKKQEVMADNAEREGQKQRIVEIQQFLAGQTEQIEEYDENLVRRMVEKITVYEDKYAVEFKSGASVDVER